MPATFQLKRPLKALLKKALINPLKSLLEPQPQFAMCEPSDRGFSTSSNRAETCTRPSRILATSCVAPQQTASIEVPAAQKTSEDVYLPHAIPNEVTDPIRCDNDVERLQHEEEPHSSTNTSESAQNNQKESVRTNEEEPTQSDEVFDSNENLQGQDACTELDPNTDEDTKTEDSAYEDPRDDWEPIRNLPDEVICKLVLHYQNPTGKLPLERIHVLWRSEGSFHHVVCVGLIRGPKNYETYIIRIPAHGTTKNWTPKDSYNMAREIDTMTLVGAVTSVPVPHIYASSTDCDNLLGHPFIMMSKVKGQSACHLWHDRSYAKNDAWKCADVPSAETERKRINFLQSLARVMDDLQCLKFSQSGAPIAEKPTWDDDDDDFEWLGYPAGPIYRFHSATDINTPVEIKPCNSTKDFFEHGIEFRFGDRGKGTVDDSATIEELEIIGARKIMEIVCSQPAFHPKTLTDFTLQLADLDLQNIYTDEEGNVTGIIDWDGAFAAPRCVGAAAVPRFLRSDWYPSTDDIVDMAPYMVWQTEHYRQVYASALYEIDQIRPDMEYTTKSGLYQAVISSLFSSTDDMVEDLTHKLLREIRGVRMHPDMIKVGLAKGWPAVEDMLQLEIAKILKPEMPLPTVDDAIAQMNKYKQEIADFKAQLLKAENEGIVKDDEAQCEMEEGDAADITEEDAECTTEGRIELKDIFEPETPINIIVEPKLDLEVPEITVMPPAITTPPAPLTPPSTAKDIIRPLSTPPKPNKVQNPPSSTKHFATPPKPAREIEKCIIVADDSSSNSNPSPPGSGGTTYSHRSGSDSSDDGLEAEDYDPFSDRPVELTPTSNKSRVCSNLDAYLAPMTPDTEATASDLDELQMNTILGNTCTSLDITGLYPLAPCILEHHTEPELLNNTTILDVEYTFTYLDDIDISTDDEPAYPPMEPNVDFIPLEPKANNKPVGLNIKTPALTYEDIFDPQYYPKSTYGSPVGSPYTYTVKVTTPSRFDSF